jgi:hypothetical protein
MSWVGGFRKNKELSRASAQQGPAAAKTYRPHHDTLPNNSNALAVS